MKRKYQSNYEFLHWLITVCEKQISSGKAQLEKTPESRTNISSFHNTRHQGPKLCDHAQLVKETGKSLSKNKRIIEVQNQSAEQTKRELKTEIKNEIQNEMNEELWLESEVAKKERDFYFGKLLRIEQIVNEHPENVFFQAISNILYETYCCEE